MTAKRYKELAAKSRVPMGFVLLAAYVLTAHPSWTRFVAGSLIALSGILLRAWAAGHLDKNRDLCVSGPYAHLRNPLYVGTALVAVGFSLAGGVWWIALIFAAVLLLVYLPVVNEEEAHLRTLFPSFADYATRVPRFLPRLTRGAASAAAFRGSLYMQNQEYNALAGYLLVLALLLWKLMRSPTLTLLLLLCACSTSVAAQAPFSAGETLDYDISWRVFGAGKARMTLAEAPAPAHGWRATVEATSTAVISRLYKVEDVFRSTFRNDTYCSEQLTKTIHEGQRHRDIHIDFLTERKVAAIREMDLVKNREVRQQENPIPPCAFDVLSSLYYVRTLKLEVGHPFQVPINDGGHTILIDVEVQAKEDIKLPFGTIHAIRIEPQVFGGTLFKKSGRMQIWLADDASHRLLQLKARLFFGNVTATVTK